jgi:hypothetical protein
MSNKVRGRELGLAESGEVGGGNTRKTSSIFTELLGAIRGSEEAQSSSDRTLSIMASSAINSSLLFANVRKRAELLGGDNAAHIFT